MVLHRNESCDSTWTRNKIGVQPDSKWRHLQSTAAAVPVLAPVLFLVSRLCCWEQRVLQPWSLARKLLPSLEGSSVLGSASFCGDAGCRCWKGHKMNSSSEAGCASQGWYDLKSSELLLRRFKSVVIKHLVSPSHCLAWWPEKNACAHFFPRFLPKGTSYVQCSRQSLSCSGGCVSR